MRLYTEEQVRDMLNINVEFDKYTPNIDSILTDYSPIELPSDEEIGQEFKLSSDNWEVRQELEVGAKWMRDKIKGGEK